MSYPEKIQITARIPHPNTPETFVVGIDGKLPSAEHTGGTREDTLHTLAERVIGYSVSVAQRRIDLESTNEIVYDTKPEPLDQASPREEAGYHWGLAPQHSAEDGLDPNAAKALERVG